MGRYAMYTARLVNSLNQTLDLKQLDAVSFQGNQNLVVITPSGDVDPADYILASARPTLRLTTGDLFSVFGSLSLANGVCIGGGTAETLSAVGFRQRAECGAAFLTGTNHFLAEFSKGFLYLTNITAEQDSQTGARAELELLLETNELWEEGATTPFKYVPIRFDDENALAGLPAAAWMSTYHLGPMFIGNTSVPANHVPGLISLRIDPGINYTVRATDGLLVGGEGAVTARLPKISLTFLRLNAIAASLPGLLVTSVGATTFFLRRGSTDSSGRAADNAGTHIAVSITGGAITTDDISVTGQDDATITFTVNVKGQLAVATNANIPATA